MAQQTTSTRIPGFDREQWTTIHIARLTPGDILAFRAERHRPAVLESARLEPVPGDEYGLIHGVMRYLDSGDTAQFKVRENTPVLLRCDIRYAPTT